MTVVRAPDHVPDGTILRSGAVSLGPVGSVVSWGGTILKNHFIRAAQRLTYITRRPDEKRFDFERRHRSPFKRPPLQQVMMLDDIKVMYLPIGKNACSSTKRAMALLGGLSLDQSEDIHRTLDDQNTGLIFANRDDDDIREALLETDWMRFAIIRDPLERLVSAYVEKFVVNRLSRDVRITCDPVLMRTLKLGWLREQDYERGISFRVFANDIMAHPPNLLDPHWRPQSQLMKDYPSTHIYHIDDLDILSRDLEAHIGRPVQIPRSNVSRFSGQCDTDAGSAADSLPGDLESPQHLSVSRFFDDTLRRQVLAYHAEDLELIARSGH